MISRVLGWLKDFFSNLFSAILDFFSNLFGTLFQGLINFLKALFSPVLILIALIFYVIGKLGELVFLLFKVLLAIGRLLYQFVIGFFNTLQGLVWQPSTPSHGSWSPMISEVFTALAPYQLDKIAYVIMFAIWIMTAYGAIKILSRSGGGEG